MRIIRRFNRFLLIVFQSLFMLWVVSSLPVVWAILCYVLSAVILDILITVAIEEFGFVDFISTKALDADEYELKNFPKPN